MNRIPVAGKRALACAIAAILLAGAAPALADDDTADTDSARGAPVTLDQVVVTAERRATDLQKTPLAVGVIGGERLDRDSVRSLTDIRPGTVAGLDFPNQAGPNMGYRAIRGIGTGAPTTNAAVALYADDVFLPRIINGGIFGLPDVERIEVLRGPQGTLYGQSSSAGAIRIISITPDDAARAWASAGFGSHGTLELKGLVSGAIRPGLLYGSFAYAQRENDGTVWNATLGKDVNRVDTRQARAKFRLTPNDATEITLSIDVLDDATDNYAWTRANAEGWEPRVTYENKELLQGNTAAGFALNVASRLTEALEFKSITAWRQWEIAPNVWSYDGVPDYRYGWELDLDGHQFSQELQLNGSYDRLDFTAGVIGFVERLDVDRPAWTNRVYAGIASQTDVKSYAAYGQLRYAFTPRFGLTAGARFGRQSDAFDWVRYSTDSELERLEILDRLEDLEQRTSSFTPKVGVDFQWTPDTFVYFNIAKGEKSGGYNPVSGARAVAAIPVRPEEVTSYEFGLKNTALAGRLNTNLALFYNDFEDYQAGVANPVVDGQVVNGSVQVNAAEATLYGAEVEASFRATGNLLVHGSVTYVDSEFDEFLNPTGAPNSDFKGRPLPVPEWLAGLGIDYQVPLAIPGYLSLNATVSYRSEVPQLNAERTVYPERTLVDAGVTYQFAEGTWSVSAGVRNLLDETYAQQIQLVPAYDIVGHIYNDPRTWLITLRKDFR
ncbi:TonB-dependent receptor [Luteimonas sp. Y-2-2-4F]|nr:TonB-dependent receptor [Luteimonas sp. Y-2-2-4F]MCD9033305.1 TonB-dependent receptor [Luteimonas sp. Y-2-2-4F]